MKEVIERLKEKSSECAFPFVSAETFSMGMSLRDYFAAAVAQGICSRSLVDLANESNSVDKDVKTYVAEAAYAIANTMLEARMKDLKNET